MHKFFLQNIGKKIINVKGKFPTGRRFKRELMRNVCRVSVCGVAGQSGGNVSRGLPPTPVIPPATQPLYD